MKTRCEGWRRSGGAFTLGPVKWVQCENDAIVTLKVKQETVEDMPACLECWNEAKSVGIEILSADLLAQDGKANAHTS